MELAEYFPVWKDLTLKQQEQLSAQPQSERRRRVLCFVAETKRVWGWYWFAQDSFVPIFFQRMAEKLQYTDCLSGISVFFSASCMMNSIQFDIMIEAEKDSEIQIIAPDVYRQVMEESRRTGKLHQSNYGRPVFRSDVAGGKNYVAEF